MDLKIFSGAQGSKLAIAISRYIGGQTRDDTRSGLPKCLGFMEVKRFPDGEERIQFEENIRDCDVFLIQATNPPTENFMRLLMMIDAARRASAHRITAVIPYFGYARQDRKDRPRVPITSKLAVKMLEAAGVDRVLTMDLHVNQMEGFFEVPLDHLYARPVLIQELLKMHPEARWRIVAPDAGAANRAEGFSQRMGQLPIAHVHKVRNRDGKIERMTVIGDIEPSDTVAIIDDMIDTGGTLINVAKAIKDRGPKEIIAVAAHGILSNNAEYRIDDSPIDHVFITDTIPRQEPPTSQDLTDPTSYNKIKLVSVAPLFGEAIRRIHTGQGSISELFK